MTNWINWGIYGGVGLVGLIAISGLRIIQETERAVRLRFGKYTDVLDAGLKWIIPGVDTLMKVDIRERVIDMDPQEMLTKDKVSLKVDAMVLWKIKGDGEDKLKNAKKSVIDVKNVQRVMEEKAQAELREIISEKTFAEVLGQRDTIAEKLKADLDTDTDKWGIDVTSVQIKDVSLPKGMKRAMAQKAEAEIEKEARITKADAERKAFEIMKDLGQIAKDNPAILELRRIQMINEIGAEQNTTTVIMIPTEITSFLKGTNK